MEKRIIPVVTAIIEKDNKFLMLKRSETNKTNKNRWQFTEGKIEYGEKPLEALKREVREETNLEVISSSLLGFSTSTVDFPEVGAAFLIRLIFRCRTEGEIKLSEEHSKWEFFGIDEMDSIDIAKGLVIEDFKKLIRQDPEASSSR